jgi:hypothetical protein
MSASQPSASALESVDHSKGRLNGFVESCESSRIRFRLLQFLQDGAGSGANAPSEHEDRNHEGNDDKYDDEADDVPDQPSFMSSEVHLSS